MPFRQRVTGIDRTTVGEQDESMGLLVGDGVRQRSRRTHLQFTAFATWHIGGDLDCILGLMRHPSRDGRSTDTAAMTHGPEADQSRIAIRVQWAWFLTAAGVLFASVIILIASTSSRACYDSSDAAASYCEPATGLLVLRGAVIAIVGMCAVVFCIRRAMRH